MICRPSTSTRTVTLFPYTTLFRYHRDRRARQHRDELALAAAAAALPARQLYRVGGVEHHRAAGVAHYRQRAHVADQVVVAEAGAALADHDVGVARQIGRAHV